MDCSKSKDHACEEIFIHCNYFYHLTGSSIPKRPTPREVNFLLRKAVSLVPREFKIHGKICSNENVLTFIVFNTKCNDRLESSFFCETDWQLEDFFKRQNIRKDDWPALSALFASELTRSIYVICIHTQLTQYRYEHDWEMDLDARVIDGFRELRKRKH